MMNAKWSPPLALVLSLAVMPLYAQAIEPTAEQAEFFEKKVRPILVDQCFSCHSATAPKLQGGLRLDSRDAALAGGDSGPALVPRRPDKSKLIEVIAYKNVDLQMPPKAKLSDGAIADLTAWVKMGAPWPNTTAPKAIAKEKEAFNIEKRKAAHWAWQPIRDHYPPRVKDESWPLQNLDRFILGNLEAKGIAPAKPAEPHVLLRRIYFDLIGLPPKPDEIANFEKQYRATPQAAVAKVVDRLLAIPQFGERWARHWLDLVRYGESRGHEFDPTIPNAWQYRDYVIRAFNGDVPYNQFVMEHLAGDLLPSPRLHPQEKFNESILGTGFWHLGEEVHSPVDIRGDEADRFDNRIDVMTKTFLALTVSCARCHDHKFDAIGTKDYYALYGFLRSSHYRQVPFDTLEHNKRIMKQLEELREKYQLAILKAYSETFRRGVAYLHDWLLEARESIVSGKRSEIEQVRFWVTYLEKAQKNPNDPFYSFANHRNNDPIHLPSSDLSFDRNPLIVEYSWYSSGKKWLPDEGFRRVKAGEPFFGTDKLRPIVRFYDKNAAELDTANRNMQLAAGNQNDYGALGTTVRAGRTLNTPGFMIESGKVHFLVKGNGKSYAAVAAHTIIGGPLHAALVKDFNTGGKWRWITHDLTTYKEQRAHLEFSPSDESDFAVAKVTQGDEPAIVESMTRKSSKERTVFDVSAGALNSLEIGKLYLCPTDEIAFANWMLDNAGLLGVENWDKVSAAAAPFIEEQAKLIAQLRKESHLAPAMIDGSGYNEHVFIRGSHKALGETVPRRFLEALAGPKGIESTGSGRLELAQQMTDPNINPFITRVIVNRVWHHLFGRGIVASTDNFGVLGERPTHPELLDHLAVRFAQEGWSMKKLIRELILTRAYQMSSHPDKSADEADPENLLLHGMRLRRLEGEAIRDAMLSISGRLEPSLYGPSVLVHLTPFLDGRGKPKSGPIDGDGRRSLYIATRRNFLAPMMLAFDTPSPFSTVGRRTVSNVPAQALILMNDPFVHQMAALWGKNLAAGSESANDKITGMYLSAFTRRPTEAELKDCVAFLEARKNSIGEVQAWSELAHVVFNVKEFIFVE